MTLFDIPPEKQAELRQISEAAKRAGTAPVMPFNERIEALLSFQRSATPDVVLALLTMLENTGTQNTLPESARQTSDLASTAFRRTRWPHRTVVMAFDHPGAGDKKFSPMMLLAHQELSAGGACENNFTASNGVHIQWVNLTTPYEA